MRGHRREPGDPGVRVRARRRVEEPNGGGGVFWRRIDAIFANGAGAGAGAEGGGLSPGGGEDDGVPGPGQADGVPRRGPTKRGCIRIRRGWVPEARVVARGMRRRKIRRAGRRRLANRRRGGRKHARRRPPPPPPPPPQLLRPFERAQAHARGPGIQPGCQPRRGSPRLWHPRLVHAAVARAEQARVATRAQQTVEPDER